MVSVERVAARAIPIDKHKIAELAKELVQKLKPRLNVKDKESPVGQVIQVKHLEFEAGIFTGKTVFGNDVSIPIWVRWTNKSAGLRRYVPSGSAKGKAHKLKGRTYFFQMSLNLDLNRSANDFLTHLDEVEKEAYHVLIHEITHVLDNVQAMGESNKDMEGSSYYNDPAEVRAFLQQIVHEADEYLEYYGKLVGFSAKVSGPWAGLIENCLDKSKTWDRIRLDLTDQNERLIRKALTRHVQDEWADLVKKYPEEVIDDGEEPWEEDNIPWLQRKVAARAMVVS